MKRPEKKLGPDFDLRPIGARALKSARDTLRPFLSESRVLDLFAGQGRFGITALEEGASQVHFVELNRGQALRLQKETVAYEERARVWIADALTILKRDSLGAFDLVFADPPYSYWKENFASHLFAHVGGRLKPGAIFLVKHPTRMVIFGARQSFSPWKSVPFGEATLAYYRYGTE